MNDVAAPSSLYIHTPFCERRCHYCDFVAVAGTRGEEDYVAALVTEIGRLSRAAPGTVLNTVFIGGGTPSLLQPVHIEAITAAVRDGFSLAPNAEITMEANPSSTSLERARVWRECGVTRVSLGVQSFDPGILEFLGRVHDRDRAIAAVGEVREAGLDAVSCDLIYAVPGLSDAVWRDSLSRIIDLDPGHISCYELTVEEGTPLHTLVARGRVTPVESAPALRQHWMAADMLAAAGYAQYEVSNYSRPGRESRHNLVYWRNGTYLAAGVGAHGHLTPPIAIAMGMEGEADAVAWRYWHGRDIRGYIDGVAAGGFGITGQEPVSPLMRRAETVMMGLRLNEGVATGDVDMAAARDLAAAGMVAIQGDRVVTTRRGQEVLNEIATRLAPEAVTA